MDDIAGPPPTPRYRRALECVLGLPATDGNEIDVLRNGGPTFSAMLEAIRSANVTVDLETFGDWSGSVAREMSDALAERAASGVRVRVLLDALGSRRMDRALLQRVISAGVEVRWFRPLTNWRVTQSTHRGHRRVLVCDNAVGITGGFAVGDRWRGTPQGAGEWRDTALRLRGPAVGGLWGAFVDNWAETGEPLFDESVDRLPVAPHPAPSAVQVVRGDAETGWGEMGTLVRALIGLARIRLRISADYFVPDDDAVALLGEAVRRGVKVEVLRPGRHADSRTSQRASEAQYPRLLGAGVDVWAYQPSVLKARVVTVDGEIGVLGGLNFNARSLTLDDELSVVVLDPRVVAVLDGHFDDDLARAVAVAPSTWRSRSPLERATGATLGYLARRF